MKRRTWLTSGLALGLGGTLAARMLRPREPYSFGGKAVLITGGSRGLGLILARQLAGEGARLALMARDGAELERAVQELHALGAEVMPIVGDVSSREDAQAAVERTAAHFGRIDVLINNAGIIQAGPVEHMKLEDFELTLAVHLWGPLYTMFAAIPRMRAQGEGRIVNIASIGGRVSLPHLVPYNTSKFALVGASQGLRSELAKDNILITTVAPGIMRTGSPFNAFFKGQHKTEFRWFTIMSAIPGISIDAGRAAHQIIEACRSGKPHLTISTPARVLEIATGLFPNLTSRVLEISARLLPGPSSSAEGDELRSGWESQSALAPSPLTYATNQAAIRNNEVGSNPPPG